MKLYEVKYAPNSWTSDRQTVRVVAANIHRATVTAIKGKRYGAYVSYAIEVFTDVKVDRG